jgi:hypothetical protein
MQIKMASENVEPMLKSGEFEISYRSESQIVATKPIDYGRIHMRLKLQSPRYSLQERHYWLANIHFERGLRPQRIFDSNKIKEFVDQYIRPYTKSSS